MEIPKVNELESQLFKAVRGGNFQEVQALIQKGVNLDSKNKNGIMPLHHAAALGQESILEALLENGAKIDDKDSSQLTPLQIAVLCEQL